MTEEEKKLFEKIKRKSGYGIRTQASYDVIEEMEGTRAKEKAIEYQGEFNFLIYLIEKLQKENLLLSAKENMSDYFEFKRNYISKDKIRELFKELYIIEGSKYAKIKTTDNDKLYKFAYDIEKLLQED